MMNSGSYFFFSLFLFRSPAGGSRVTLISFSPSSFLFSGSIDDVGDVSESSPDPVINSNYGGASNHR